MSFVLLGHHRTGSSYMLDVIRHNKNVETINEPFSMHLDFFREDETFWPDKQAFFSQVHDSSCTATYINDLNNWLNEKEYNVVRGFKETSLFEKYDWLISELNISNTIILVRDFRATINSVIKRNMQNSWWDYKGRLEKYYKYEVDKLDDIEICAYLLKERMSYIKIIVSNNEVMLIRLEDFFDDRLLFTEKLMNYIGLNLCKEQEEFIKLTSINTRNSTYSNYRNRHDVLLQWKDMLSRKDVERINGILKEELEFFGYFE